MTTPLEQAHEAIARRLWRQKNPKEDYHQISDADYDQLADDEYGDYFPEAKEIAADLFSALTSSGAKILGGEVTEGMKEAGGEYLMKYFLAHNITPELMWQKMFAAAPPLPTVEGHSLSTNSVVDHKTENVSRNPTNLLPTETSVSTLTADGVAFEKYGPLSEKDRAAIIAKGPGEVVFVPSSSGEEEVERVAIEISIAVDGHGDPEPIERQRAKLEWRKYERHAEAAISAIRRG